MEQIWQIIAASGILMTLMTLVITKLVNNQFDEVKKWQETKTRSEFLVMQKLDMQGKLTILMAKRLHDAGIINGDLEELKQQYKEADSEYDKHIRQLAAEVLRK